MSAASYEAANNQITFAWKSLNFYVLLLISMCNATYMHPGLTYQLKTKAYYAYTCIPRSAGARRLRKTLKRRPAGLAKTISEVGGQLFSTLFCRKK